MTQDSFQETPTPEVKEERRNSWEVLTDKSLLITLSSPRKRVLAFQKLQKQNVMKKVEDAIRNIVICEKKATYPAILKWIAENNGYHNAQNLQNNVKKAIGKGLRNGTIVRTRNSRKALGINGSFLLRVKGEPKPKINNLVKKQTDMTKHKESVKETAEILRKEEKSFKSRLSVNAFLRTSCCF